MGINKKDTAVIAGLALLVLGGGAALAASGDKKKLPGGAAKKPQSAASAADDGAKLEARANQKQANDWVPIFMDAGVSSPLEAYALARWAGIESSGNAHAVSSLGERGLMQAGPQSVSEGLMTKQDWDAINNSATTNKEQAVIANNYVTKLWGVAATHMTDPPADPVDQIWYAKMWHQRPKDFTDNHLHGNAESMAKELAQKWANDPKAMHRLRSANVVAFGTAGY